MQCQSCSNPATVHLTDIQPAGKKKQIHLCESCAEKKNLVSKKEMNLSVILQALIGANLSRSQELARLTCPICGIKFMEFRAEGRLGCPHDYEVFREGLEPLLQRIHRAAHHVGKAPRFRKRSAHGQRDLLELRSRLRQAVEGEAFEEAAKLRDMIRQKENLG